MRHDIFFEGHGYRLRPVNDADAAFVVDLRNNTGLNQFIHQSSNRIEDQVNWFSNYYLREGDYYFVVERRDNHVSEGLISIYDINPDIHRGEWGRWILRPGSLAAVESVWLLFHTAFDLLCLESVYSRTIANNEKVVSFHDSCGITDRRPLPQCFEIDGHWFDAIEHRVDRHSWTMIEPRLKKLSKITAQKVARA
ncbi:MAG: GNAT family N-acetyltransferase [Leptospirales bacterium]